MKFIFSLLLILSFTLAKAQVNYMYFNNQLGLRKYKIKTETFYCVNKNNEKTINTVNEYDSFGNLISIKTYSTRGKELSSEQRFYEEGNRLAKVIDYKELGKIDKVWTFDGKLLDSYQHSKLVNGNNKLLYEDSCTLDTTAHTIYVFQLTQNIKFDKFQQRIYTTDTLLKKNIHTYFNDGIYASSYEYAGKNMVRKNNVYINGETITYTSYDSSGKIVSARETKINKHSSWSKDTHFTFKSGDNGLNIERTSYNDKNYIIQRTPCSYTYY